MHQHRDRQYSEMYIFEIAFSLCVCVFLWNLTVLMSIRYGDQMITHLSVSPYMFSLILVTIMIFEFLGLTFLGNVYENRWRTLL